MLRNFYCRGNDAKPFYALSQVFVVESVTVTDREVRSSPAIGDTYRLDEPIEIALQFSEKVAVQGTPWLNLAIGSGRGRAEYVDGSGTDTLVFRHVVQAGDRDTNGFQVIGGSNGIVLDGATIRTSDGLDVDTALPGSWIEGDKVDGSLVLTGGVCERTAQVRQLIMDGIVPRSTQAGIGCSEVTLELLREATTGFRRFSIFLKDKGIESLKAGDFEGFEAARIVELDGNRLTTLPAGLFDGLGEVTDLRLQDNALTSLQAVAFAGLDKLEKLDLSNNALAAGAIDDGTFEGLTRLSTLKLEGNPGAATFGPGADAGTGRTLSAGEVVTLEGKATGTGPWGSNVRYAWTQTDGEDNEGSPTTVTLSATDVPRPTFTVPVLNSGATVKLTLTVTVRPFGSDGSSASSTATFEILPLAVTDVSIVSVPQAADTYRAGETIEVAATFGDTVLVDTAGGKPTIRIDLTVNPVRAFRPASYARGSGTNRLVFAYTVQAADRDSDGLGVVEGTLALNGGTITSVNGAKALLLNAAVAASPSHKVDGGSAALDLALGVCDRTPQIRDALVAKVSGAERLLRGDERPSDGDYRHAQSALLGDRQHDDRAEGGRLREPVRRDRASIGQQPSARHPRRRVRPADRPDAAGAGRQPQRGGRRPDLLAGGAVRRADEADDPEPVRQRPGRAAAAAVREAGKAEPVESRIQPRQRALPAAREGRPRGRYRRGGGHGGAARRRGGGERPGRPVGRERHVFMDPARRRGGPAHERGYRAADLHGAGFGGRHDPDLPAQGPGPGPRRDPILHRHRHRRRAGRGRARGDRGRDRLGAGRGFDLPAGRDDRGGGDLQRAGRRRHGGRDAGRLARPVPGRRGHEPVRRLRPGLRDGPAGVRLRGAGGGCRQRRFRRYRERPRRRRRRDPGPGRRHRAARPRRRRGRRRPQDRRVAGGADRRDLRPHAPGAGGDPGAGAGQRRNGRDLRGRDRHPSRRSDRHARPRRAGLGQPHRVAQGRRLRRALRHRPPGSRQQPAADGPGGRVRSR